MTISNDLLRKQHDYNKQSYNTNILIAIFIAFMFSINNTPINSNVLYLIIGGLILNLLYEVLKVNYRGVIYESRIVDKNTTDPYEKTLLEIKKLDLDKNRNWFKVWFKSYFSFGFKDYIRFLIIHIILSAFGFGLIIFSLVSLIQNLIF